MTIIASHYLAERNRDTTTTVPAFEPGANIIPIGWAHRQINVAMHAASPAVSGQLVAVLLEISECLEGEAIFHG